MNFSIAHLIAPLFLDSHFENDCSGLYRNVNIACQYNFRDRVQVEGRQRI